MVCERQTIFNVPVQFCLEPVGGADEGGDAVGMETVIDLVLAMNEILQLQEEGEVRFRLRAQNRIIDY